ncbi:MAG: helix-turn-helix domain-containing protein [Treponema sp.]|nr:helix-turn-helix domain-containing protein [Treponema sp.]
MSNFKKLKQFTIRERAHRSACHPPASRTGNGELNNFLKPFVSRRDTGALHANKLYEIFKAKDARFDGRFFVGVSSTGIYCRPVCTARIPKKENCLFFSSAAQAEQAGFRPCLLCRPELAPGTAGVDASSALASCAAKLLQENCGSAESIACVAQKLGYTDRHVRRVFTEAFHVSPSQYVQTCRLLLAKSLLTDTQLSMIAVAMASGFGSVRRFNDAFQKRYHMPPSAVRKAVHARTINSADITILLGYRPPYRYNELLDFFARRAIHGVELVRDGAYMRTVRLTNSDGNVISGWLRVQHVPHKHALSLQISESLIPVLPHVISKVRSMFDVDSTPHTIAKALASMNRVRPGLFKNGTRMPGCFEPFEMAVRAILGQQITVKAACTLASRIAATYGTAIETEVDGLTTAFPTPHELLRHGASLTGELSKLGIIAARAQTIESLAKAFVGGTLSFDIIAAPEDTIQKLRAMKGIGNWSAQYIAMRALSYTDAFLETDYGVKKSLAGYTPQEIRALSETWKPWRSYATVSLWNSLQ